MAKILARHIKFINLVAKGHTQSDAYKVSYGKDNVSKGYAEKEGCILAKRYALEIQEQREKDAALISIANNADIVKTALESVVAQAVADQKSFRVLSDDDMVDDIYLKNGVPTPFKRKPTQLEIQKAYSEYCKRFGSYMPSKVAQTDTKGNDVEPTMIIWGEKNINI